MPLVLDLRITHDRFGSISDPSLNGQGHLGSLSRKIRLILKNMDTQSTISA
jgi:hypothetical protein